MYTDDTTIRSRAARRRIEWRGNAEKFSAGADEEIRENVKALLNQVENGYGGDDPNIGNVSYTVEEAREIDDEIAKRTKRTPIYGKVYDEKAC